MPAPLKRDEAKRRIALVEKYLRQGALPYGASRAPSGSPNAITMAARELETDRDGLMEQVKPGGVFEQRFDLKVDWALYQPPAGADQPKQQSLADRQEAELRQHRQREELKAARAEIKNLRDQLIAMGDMRDWVGGLSATVQRPKIAPYVQRLKGTTGHTAQVSISDVHCGEVVNIDEMSGLNAYSPEICRSRLERLRDKVVFLLTKHTNVKLDELVVNLMGDLISGGLFLHEELARTDDPMPAQAVALIAEIVASVLIAWAQTLKIPIRVHCVPGNHGRTTRKNEAKKMVANSLDILACQFIERHCQGENIEFFYPASGEALYSIYGWRCLALHGHNMGSRGGGGVYGPGYAMIRGGYATRASYEARGITIDYIFHGHFHTTSKPLPFLYGNGSVIGPAEWSMNLNKMLAEAAKQNFHLFHPSNGIVDWREIVLGVPGEGSLYEPR